MATKTSQPCGSHDRWYWVISPVYNSFELELNCQRDQAAQPYAEVNRLVTPRDITASLHFRIASEDSWLWKLGPQ